MCVFSPATLPSTARDERGCLSKYARLSTSVPTCRSPEISADREKGFDSTSTHLDTLANDSDWAEPVDDGEVQPVELFEVDHMLPRSLVEGESVKPLVGGIDVGFLSSSRRCCTAQRVRSSSNCARRIESIPLLHRKEHAGSREPRSAAMSSVTSSAPHSWINFARAVLFFRRLVLRETPVRLEYAIAAVRELLAMNRAWSDVFGESGRPGRFGRARNRTERVILRVAHEWSC